MKRQASERDASVLLPRCLPTNEGCHLLSSIGPGPLLPARSLACHISIRCGMSGGAVWHNCLMNPPLILQRLLLFTILNNTVPPTNETVKQVFSRISALRDSLDGPQFDDQGLVNTDPRTNAVPDSYINL